MLSTVTVAVCVVVTLCTLATLGFKLSEKNEAIRRQAAQDSARLREEGYPFVPDLLECFAFRDRSGEIAVIRDAVRAIRDPAKMLAVKEQFLRRQLSLACADPERVSAVAEIVSQYLPVVQEINAILAETIEPAPATPPSV